MTYNALSNLLGVLNELSKIGTTFEFDYALTKNINHIDSIFKPLQKALVVEKIKDYQQELSEINLKYCIKNDSGDPVYKITGQYQEYTFSEENKPIRIKEVEKLQKKYKKELDEQKEKNESFQKKMESDCEEFKPYKIKLEHLKEAKEKVGQRITAQHMVGLSILIEE